MKAIAGIEEPRAPFLKAHTGHGPKTNVFEAPTRTGALLHRTLCYIRGLRRIYRGAKIHHHHGSCQAADAHSRENSMGRSGGRRFPPSLRVAFCAEGKNVDGRPIESSEPRYIWGIHQESRQGDAAKPAPHSSPFSFSRQGKPRKQQKHDSLITPE